MMSPPAHLISNRTASQIQRIQEWELFEEFHASVRDVFTVAEGEVGQGDTNWGQSKERDVAQFDTIRQVQFPQLGAVGSLDDVPYSQIRHPEEWE